MPKKRKSDGHTSQNKEDDEDDNEICYAEKIIRAKNTKRAPLPPVASSESEAASSKAGDSDVDTEAFEEKSICQIIGCSRGTFSYECTTLRGGRCAHRTRIRKIRVQFQRASLI